MPGRRPDGVGNGNTGVTQWPASISNASTWDRRLVRSYGAAYGAEQAGKGRNIALAPTINILRTPLWGRSFETFTEDPFLNGQLAVSEIHGIQSQHVIATPKHFVANNQEVLRNSIDVLVSQRALHEIYYPGFEAAVTRGGAGSVMCSYNRINGPYACENPDTLNAALKGTFGFDGFVMSDWGATHSTVDAANGGLDMEMPGGVGGFFGPEYFGQALKDAVLAGEVPQARLDDMVTRILTSMFRVGLFDHPTPDPATTAHGRGDLAGPPAARHEAVAERQRAAAQRRRRAAARRGLRVLDRGHRRRRPRPPADPGRRLGRGRPVAPAGHAARRHHGACRQRRPRQLRRGRDRRPPRCRRFRAARSRPRRAPARACSAPTTRRPTSAAPPVATQVDPHARLRRRADRRPADTWSAVWTGTVTAPADGTYTFSLSTSGARTSWSTARSWPRNPGGFGGILAGDADHPAGRGGRADPRRLRRRRPVRRVHRHPPARRLGRTRTR